MRPNVMFSRPRKFAAALLAVVAVLFLQATAAFAACELPAGGGARAAMQASAMPDCHEAEEAQALCQAHCQGEDQAIGKIQPDLPSLPPVAPEIPNFEPFAEVPARLAPSPTFAGPPARILYQSFLL